MHIDFETISNDIFIQMPLYGQFQMFEDDFFWSGRRSPLQPTEKTEDNSQPDFISETDKGKPGESQGRKGAGPRSTDLG